MPKGVIGKYEIDDCQIKVATKGGNTAYLRKKALRNLKAQGYKVKELAFVAMIPSVIYKPNCALFGFQHLGETE